MLLLCETHPYVLILTHRTRFWSLGINISTFEKNHFLVFFTFFEFVGFPSKNSSKKNLKKSNFQFWIFRWIRPIFMFYKRENMSFECLNPNSQYRVHISRPRGKNGFFAVRCRFSALFENSICGFFLEMSEGTEISTVKISGKKLMILVHLPYKYLSHTTITLEYIGKTNRLVFFSTSQ